MSAGATAPQPIILHEQQAWRTRGSAKPSRTIREMSHGFLNWNDARGVDQFCSVREFEVWVRRYGACVVT